MCVVNCISCLRKRKRSKHGTGYIWCWLFLGGGGRISSIGGVRETAVGYSGGHSINPTYEDVCGGNTGHVEVVRIIFDPEVITYESLLNTFWASHDPTQVNRQGPDVGSQYRTVIFVHDEVQRKIAEESKDQLQASQNAIRIIATTIEEVGDYWMAEDYHQQFIEKRRSVGFGR